ncbi:MAG: ROK family protein [Ignavibacteriae bacterium]|nr:ROK family protein [Ignavibacteria bacterium]MBI3363286.1 ROK family protein [Ignavibacteriota bacterium]
MTPKKTYAVGVDMGATTIKSCVVDLNGKILDQLTVDTKASKGPEIVVQQIMVTVQELFTKHKPAECLGIGIGAPGVVNVNTGTVLYPPNFADWTEVALEQVIRKTFPLPVSIENDANCAALAEAKHGAGSDVKDFIFVIWGTGVGGGIILDREIYRGPFGGAGEIGHVSIDYNGPLCNCGNRGCIEAYIGQRYLSARTKEILESEAHEGVRSKIQELVEGNLVRIEPTTISMAAQQGDRTAIEILEEAGDLLGCTLASVINVLDIRTVVVGGGISAAPKFVFDAIHKGVASRVLKPHRLAIRILRATLGNSAGMIGAASLVM